MSCRSHALLEGFRDDGSIRGLFGGASDSDSDRDIDSNRDSNRDRERDDGDGVVENRLKETTGNTSSTAFFFLSSINGGML